VVDRLPHVLRGAGSWAAATTSLAPTSRLRNCTEWTDIAGLLAPVEVIRDLEARVTRGEISSYDDLLAGLKAVHDRYPEYAWQYVTETFEKEFGYRLGAIPKAQFLKILEEGQKASLSLQSSIQEDSRKEFGSAARIGYGLDLTDAESDADFEAVRGTMEGNAVVRNMARASEEITARYEAIRKAVEAAQ
jgi:hypothetical protein